MIKFPISILFVFFILLSSCVSEIDKNSSQGNDIKNIYHYFDSISQKDELELQVEVSFSGNYLHLIIDNTISPIESDSLAIDYFICHFNNLQMDFYPENVDSVLLKIVNTSREKSLTITNSFENIRLQHLRQQTHNKYFQLVTYLVSNKLYHELKGLNYIMEEMSKDYRKSLSYYKSSFLFLSKCYFDECSQEDSEIHYDNLVIMALMQIYSNSPKTLDIINFNLALCDNPAMTESEIIETYAAMGEKVEFNWNK